LRLFLNSSIVLEFLPARRVRSSSSRQNAGSQDKRTSSNALPSTPVSTATGRPCTVRQTVLFCDCRTTALSSARAFRRFTIFIGSLSWSSNVLTIVATFAANTSAVKRERAVRGPRAGVERKLEIRRKKAAMGATPCDTDRVFALELRRLAAILQSPNLACRSAEIVVHVRHASRDVPNAHRTSLERDPSPDSGARAFIRRLSVGVDAPIGRRLCGRIG
jgi:hypothetical protein